MGWVDLGVFLKGSRLVGLFGVGGEKAECFVGGKKRREKDDGDGRKENDNKMNQERTINAPDEAPQKRKPDE